MSDFMRGLIDMTPERYHADPCPVPSLSAHAAYRLVKDCAAHAYNEHPALGRFRPPTAKDMAWGALIHVFMLGKGDEQIKAVDARDWRTNAAKNARDKIEADGKIAVLVRDAQKANAIADRFKQRLRDEDGIVLDGASEQAVFWTETADDGTEVQCRGMLDHFVRHAATVYDIKTCRSAHPAAAGAAIEGYGGHIQAEAYRRAVQACCPELVGRVQFKWLFLETREPYLVQTYEAAPSMEELGGLLWRQAVNAWAKCLREDRWPRYVEGTGKLEASAWGLQRAYEMEASHSEEEAA